MAQTFNPEILEKIFIALTYFRTWVMLIFFPIIILTPDFAFNYILSIFFPSPMDIIIYNEQEFKLNKKEVNSTSVPDIVVFPFNDEGTNLKQKRQGSNNNLSIDENLEVKEENKPELKMNQDKNSKMNFRTEGKIREPESERSPISYSKPQLSKKNKDNQLYNSLDLNQERPEEVIQPVKEKNLRKEPSKEKKLKKKDSKLKKNKNNDIGKPESKRSIEKSLSKKKDSQFSDIDFEMMEGKFLIYF